MCGFALIKNRKVKPDLLSHRGIKKIQCSHRDLMLVHYSLPLQTGLGDDFLQPIELSGGGFVLYNGEIFNVPEGYKNDVDYIRAIFSDKNWKRDIVNIVNCWDGFWSIVIVQKDEIYAFTDPLGKKQLYYDMYGNISSEIKPLLRNEELDPTFNFDKPERTELTPFESVHRITPNIFYDFSSGRPNRLTNLVNMKSSFSDGKRLRDLIFDSVKSRNINLLDKNTLFVSGGLDSTIILHCIVLLGLKDNFEFITIENKEEKYIKEIEDYYEITVKRIKYEDNPVEMGEVLYSYEYPFDFGSLKAQYILVKNTNGSVIFTGDGADELFSGYGRAQLEDTQEFDVFTELPYYHMIRLDRIGMAFTKEIRSPFLSREIVSYALNCPYELRKDKAILKLAFHDIPDLILNRKKKPLRHPDMDKDRIKYLKNIQNIFYNIQYDA